MLADYTAWTAYRDAIATLLRAQSHNLDVLVDGVDINGQPTFRLDLDKRAHMTCVVWMGTDTPSGMTGRDFGSDETMCGDRELASLSWQVTCVGGDTDRAARAVFYARRALTGKRLTGGTGPVRETLDTLSIREDTSASPSRFYVPVQFSAQIP